MGTNECNLSDDYSDIVFFSFFTTLVTCVNVGIPAHTKEYNPGAYYANPDPNTCLSARHAFSV